MEKKMRNFYQKKLREINKEIKVYVDQYQEMSDAQRYALSRKKDIARKIDGILKDLQGETQETIYDHVKESAVEGFLHTMFDIEKQARVNLDFNMINEKYIENLVTKPTKGKTFSQRLYNNRRKLGQTVKQELIDGAIHGRGYKVIARNIAEQTEANYKQSLGIARTEGGRVQSETTQLAYEEAEELGVVMQKQWASSLDDTTREEHADLDGQTVGIDEDFEIDGWSAPAPRMFGDAYMDINCRCTTITVVNGISPKLRRENIKRDGKKQIINHTSYTEWKKDKI